MTDKLYCPWCGEELSNDFGVIFCYNEDCEIYGCELNERVIRDIINGKKAQDALLFISNIRGAGMSYQEMFLDAQAVAKYVSGRTSDLVLVGRYAQDELNRIIKQEQK